MAAASSPPRPPRAVGSPTGISVIINERSGMGGRVDAGGEIQALFTQAGVHVRIERVHDPGDVAARARQAAGRGDVLVAAGGDGTISTVAGVAVASGSTFGVIPMGTLNHFARDLHIPLDLKGAVDVIVAGHRHDLDVGEANGHIFINNSSVGIYPRMVWERHAEQRKGHGKWVAFAIAVVRTWRRYRTITARVSIEGNPLAVSTPFIFVGNNAYTVEGLELGARSALDQGRLSIFLAPECGRFEILMLPIRALLKRLGQAPTFLRFDRCELSISLRRRHVSVAFDGEVIHMRSPLHYRIRPGVLHAIVPAGPTPDPANQTAGATTDARPPSSDPARPR